MFTKIYHYLPSLRANIIGVVDKDNITNFRGIPYASVEKRWTHSQTDHTLSQKFNATNFGPRCVQKEGHVLVTGGESDPTPGDDEFKCLNLNVTVPKSALPQINQDPLRETLLPVMVWIHGYVMQHFPPLILNEARFLMTGGI
jgi:carboxylesterase type B